MFELTVTVKDSESTLKNKFIVYEDCKLSQDDPHIRSLIKQTLKDFKKPAESIKLKASIEVIDDTSLFEEKNG